MSGKSCVSVAIEAGIQDRLLYQWVQNYKTKGYNGLVEMKKGLSLIHISLDQAEYQKRYDGLVSRFDKANARHTEVTDLIAERMARKHQIESYLKELRSREPLTEFRETDWLAMVDYIAVHSKNDIRVTFKDGTEIKA